MTDQSPEAANQSGEAPILIKKYPNRRLYNTASSSYIVLDDIVELIRQEKDFIVEDTKTGEDLTRSILNQVIFERETAKGDFHFPLDVQKQLILMYDDAYGKMIPDYFRQSMKLFVSERDKMKSTFDDIVSQNSKAMTEFGQSIAEQNIELFNKSMAFFNSFNAKASPNADDKPASKPQDKQKELEDIENQINALQEKLKSLK